MTKTPDPDLDDTQSYDVMLEQLDRTIDEISEKIESGRIRDAEKEKVRTTRVRRFKSSKRFEMQRGNQRRGG